MPALSAYRDRLSRLLAADAAGELESLLLAESGLPGPRGNLELAHALADQLSDAPPRPGVRARLERWRALSPREAPTGDPKEYLCFCGTLAWSVDWMRGSGRRARAAVGGGLREAAGDPRWRRREAVAMALQRIGEEEPAALVSLLEPWVEDGTFLQLRAVAAALAHPPLLEDAAFAGQALALADGVLERAAAAAPGARKGEDFRVLRQGLGYALSVLAAAEPQSGFALLERWAGRKDPDLAWILKENLKKKRLARWPERVRRLSAKLGGS